MGLAVAAVRGGDGSANENVEKADLLSDDYYKVLGIEETATKKEVKKACVIASNLPELALAAARLCPRPSRRQPPFHNQVRPHSCHLLFLAGK
jgi:hypothetical protein